LIISPAAVLVARLGRHVHGAWIQIHLLLQTILTLGLTVAAIGVAIVAVQFQGTPHFADGHMVLGVVLLVLLVIQLNLGAIIHYLFNPNRTKRPIRNIAHMGLGIILFLLGFVQAGLGIGNYYRPTPTAVIVIVIVLAFLYTLIYFGSLTLLARNRHTREGRPWGEAVFGLGRDEKKRGQQTFGDGEPGRDTVQGRGRTKQAATGSWPGEKANVAADLEMQPSSFRRGSGERDRNDGDGGDDVNTDQQQH
jgi:Eukaryotic cytochrome b561